MQNLNQADEEILILALESYVDKFKNQIRAMENTAGTTCGVLRQQQACAEKLLIRLSPESFGNAVNIEHMDGTKSVVEANRK